MNKKSEVETKTKRTYNRKKPLERLVESKPIKDEIAFANEIAQEMLARANRPIVYGIWITNRDGQSGWHTDAYGIVFNTTFKCVASAQLHNLNLNASSHRAYEVKEIV